MSLNTIIDPKYAVYPNRVGDEESRRQLAKLCADLLGRIFDPATDVGTAAEQLRQGADLVLAQVRP
jgi:hypothetical protein